MAMARGTRMNAEARADLLASVGLWAVKRQERYVGIHQIGRYHYQKRRYDIKGVHLWRHRKALGKDQAGLKGPLLSW